MNVNELLEYINKNHECKHLFWRKRRGQDIDDLFKLQRKYDNTNLYFNIIRKDGLRDCLFFDFDDKENIINAIDEGNKFADRLKRGGLPVYRQLSGSKGMHVFVWIKPLEFEYYREYMLEYVDGLEYLDHSVLKNKLQLARIPLSVNPKTGKLCQPLTNNIEFTDRLNEHIKRRDKEYRREAKKLVYKKTYGLINRDEEEYDELDAHTLISYYHLDVAKEIGDKYLICCPFHNDKHPSAVLWKNGVFHCSTCNISYTPYQFIAMKEGLNPADKKRVGAVIRGEIL